MSVVKSAPVGDSVAKINDEIAVGEDLGFQRRWWRFERVVWVVFVGLIALDLAGAFGRGPLAKAEMQSSDGSLTVRYERIERTGTPSLVTIDLQSSAFVNGAATLFVNDAVVGALGAQRVIPEPARTFVGGGGLTYVFPGHDPPAQVQIELQPAGPGIFPIVIGLVGRSPLRAKVWVVP